MSFCYAHSWQLFWFIYNICCAILIFIVFGWLNKFATLKTLEVIVKNDTSIWSSFISTVLYLDILDVYQRSFMGKKVNVWSNKCVTFISNVGSEQTFENLVDKFLDQLKKKHDFWNLWMPWFSVLFFLNLFLINVVLRLFFWQYYVIF